MMEEHVKDDENTQPAEKPEEPKKLPVALRGDKTKQFTDASGVEKKG